MTFRLAWLLWLLLALLVPRQAAAVQREIVVDFELPSEAPFDRVCVHAANLAPELACKVTPRSHPGWKDLGCKDKNQDKDEAISELSQGRHAPRLAPASCPNATGDYADRCEPPPAPDNGFYSVCLNVGERAPEQDSAAGPKCGGREAHLQVHHARLRKVTVEQKRVLLGLEYSVNDAFAPRIELLGGQYRQGAVLAIRESEVLRFDLVPQCIARTLRYPASPGTSCKKDSVPLPVPGGALVSFDAKTSRGVIKLDPGRGHGTLGFTLCGATYEGSYSYPIPDSIDFAPTCFQFDWQKSCFLSCEGSARACPQATLVREGVSCHLVGQGDRVCSYRCNAEKPVAFPAPVAFQVVPGEVRPVQTVPACDGKPDATPRVTKPDSARCSTIGAKRERQSGDELVWEDSLGHPGEQLDGFVASERRRMYVGWEDTTDPVDGTCPLGPTETPDWKHPGSEIDYVEIVMPDGRKQSIQRETSSILDGPFLVVREFVEKDTKVFREKCVTRYLSVLSVPGVQCGDRFGYRYHGRYPHQPREASLKGDTLVLEEPEESRQVVIVGVRAHAGAFWYSEVHDDYTWWPAIEVDLAFLMKGPLCHSWELAASGIASRHPSVSTFDGDESWSSDWQARVLGGLGCTLYPFTADRRVYVSFGGGAGLAFPMLASDRVTTKEYFTVGPRFRVGYEFRRSVALDFSSWIFLTEQYRATTLDEFGPTNRSSRPAIAFTITGGLQWADVF